MDGTLKIEVFDSVGNLLHMSQHSSDDDEAQPVIFDRFERD